MSSAMLRSESKSSSGKPAQFDSSATFGTFRLRAAKALGFLLGKCEFKAFNNSVLCDQTPPVSSTDMQQNVKKLNPTSPNHKIQDLNPKPQT